MKFYKHLYKDKNIRFVKTLKMKLRMHAFLPSIYIVRLSENEEEQLEILQAAFLKQKYFWNDKNEIVGISTSYDGAVEIVDQILQDTMLATGGYDMRKYLIENSK